MKRFAVFFSLAMVSVFALELRGAEPVASDISNSNLSAMGLSGMTVISDDQGSKVRGMGSTAVNGGSLAFGWLFGLTVSHNNYTANSVTFSQGSNTSFAGPGFGAGGGIIAPILAGGGLVNIGGFAGGFSSAHAQ